LLAVKPLEKGVPETADRDEVIPGRWHQEPDRGGEPAGVVVVIEGEADARGIEDAENRVGNLEGAILYRSRHHRDHITHEECAEPEEIDVAAGETEVTHVGAQIGSAGDLDSGGSDPVIGVLVVHDRRRTGRHTDREEVTPLFVVKPLESGVIQTADCDEVIPVRWYPIPDHGAQAVCVVVEGETDTRGIEDAENGVWVPEGAIL
jgi:hypothetical protein